MSACDLPRIANNERRRLEGARLLRSNRILSGSDLGSHGRGRFFLLDDAVSVRCTRAMAAASRTVPSRPRNSRLKIWTGRLYEQRRRIATVAAALLVVGVAYGVVFGHNGLTVYGQKRTETRELDRELKTLGKENETLAGHVERLQSDPNAIEHQAREELHYTRPGEVIVTLPPDRPVAAGASAR